MSPVHTHTHATRIEVESLMASNGTGGEPAVTSPVAWSGSVRDKRLRKVIQMIESEELSSVQALAVEVNLSPSHLQHLFKQQTGVCITELLTEQRLRKAARHLEAGDMSIKEIAYAVGYVHASSFVRAFRHYFAQTPRAYRYRSARQAC
jgi:AraC-like DNA-binding protein